MRIAVTYDRTDESVFQHFGKSEAFKFYEIEGRSIVSAQVMGTDGTGHEALAELLAQNDVNILICGGLGDGANDALNAAGIKVLSGAEGKADDAVQAFLDGGLTSAGVNCDHHHHAEEESGCGSSCGGCGGGCSGCGGSCHAAPPAITGKNVGKICRTHYRGTFNDGTQFDSSYDRGEPLEFICGAGMMILGFDKAVANMEVGDEVDVHLMPEEAYGPYDPDALLTIKIAELPGSEGLSVGAHVVLTNAMGGQFPVMVKEKDEENIVFDANHEMAGKELNFHIELVEVK